MEKLTICIPTYNRSKILLENIKRIIKMIKELSIEDRVSILISDNHSSDIKILEQGIKDMENIRLISQEKNIGFENNLIFSLTSSFTDWNMILGDDDYFCLDYFAKVMNYIDDNKLNAIIPNFYTVNENEIQTGQPRDKCQLDIRYPKESVSLMFKAHQLSGLVIRKENGVLDNYKKNVSNNLYPQLYMLAYNLLLGECVHITETPLKNTVIQKKNFNYGVDNLINDFFINIMALDIPKSKRNELIESVLCNEFKSRVCYNLKNYIRPYIIINRINNYNLPDTYISKAKIIFIKGCFLLPIFYAKKIIKYTIRRYQK